MGKISKKKLLLISYYWQPAGGAGVQRWLKMTKYLSQYFDITIYHPQNAQYPIIDRSLYAKIPSDIKTLSYPIWEPYKWASLFSSKNKNYQKGEIEKSENQSIKAQISLWVRANFFVPDARMFWINPSVKFLSKQLEINNFDFIISTGPPHSTHLIAARLKKKYPQIKWLADFRDPWTQIDYFDKLHFLPFIKKKHYQLEKKVLQQADIVCTVSPSWKKNLEAIAQRSIELVYNGFDTEDFSNPISPNRDFTLTYVGSLNDDRNPNLLWEVLNEICDENSNFRDDFTLNLIGNISPQVQKDIAAFPWLEQHCNISEYLPHNQAIKSLLKSQILLLLINNTSNQKGIIPGKLFEYMAARRQILCIGNTTGDIAQIIRENQCGKVIDFSDKILLKNTLIEWYHLYQSNNLTVPNNTRFSKYSRENAALKIKGLLLF